ncbi:MAG: hypothetical protein BWY06_03376 [Candidatus Latescibacteria bacterium ADurb.Bin168]|nr:MAG: hypothetical protein BWY06_03376 [Candidatus Latescibacteria bacterium ADurb.Bin168]
MRAQGSRAAFILDQHGNEVGAAERLHECIRRRGGRRLRPVGWNGNAVNMGRGLRDCHGNLFHVFRREPFDQRLVERERVGVFAVFHVPTRWEVAALRRAVEVVADLRNRTEEVTGRTVDDQGRSDECRTDRNGMPPVRLHVAPQVSFGFFDDGLHCVDDRYHERGGVRYAAVVPLHRAEIPDVVIEVNNRNVCVCARHRPQCFHRHEALEAAGGAPRPPDALEVHKPEAAHELRHGERVVHSLAGEIAPVVWSQGYGSHAGPSLGEETRCPPLIALIMNAQHQRHAARLRGSFAGWGKENAAPTDAFFVFDGPVGEDEIVAAARKNRLRFRAAGRLPRDFDVLTRYDGEGARQCSVKGVVRVIRAQPGVA